MTEVLVWSGWLGGVAVGLYAIAQLIITGRPLGVSTGYGNFCGVFLRQPFFRRGSYQKDNTWRLWFLVGIPLGGAVAALTSPRSIEVSLSLGAIYDTVMPRAVWARGLVLVFGGILMGWGGRLAGGCTSGHAITGLSLLNWPSVIAASGFFIGGTLVVQLMFRVLV